MLKRIVGFFCIFLSGMTTQVMISDATQWQGAPLTHWWHWAGFIFLISISALIGLIFVSWEYMTK